MAPELESDQCDAHARHIDSTGRETVVICSLITHAPQIMHYDFRLGIMWREYESELLS